MTNTMTINEVIAANTEKLTKKINTSINKTLRLMKENVVSMRKFGHLSNEVSPDFINSSYEMGMLPKNKCVELTSVEVIERDDPTIPVMFKVTISQNDADKGTSEYLQLINSKKHNGQKLSFIEEHIAKGDLGFRSQVSAIGDNAFYALGFDIDEQAYNGDDTQYVAVVYFPPEDIVTYTPKGIAKTIKANTPEWFKKKFAKM